MYLGISLKRNIVAREYNLKKKDDKIKILLYMAALYWIKYNSKDKSIFNLK